MTKENKNKNLTIRMTDNDYNELSEKVNKINDILQVNKTVAGYIRDKVFIKRIPDDIINQYKDLMNTLLNNYKISGKIIVNEKMRETINTRLDNMFKELEYYYLITDIYSENMENALEIIYKPETRLLYELFLSNDIKKIDPLHHIHILFSGKISADYKIIYETLFPIYTTLKSDIEKRNDYEKIKNQYQDLIDNKKNGNYTPYQMVHPLKGENLKENKQ